jgi:hypothetical protein
MLKVIFLLTSLICLMQCFEINDFCSKKENKCDEKNYEYNCEGILCSKNQFSCQSLLLFSKLRVYRYEYEILMSMIKDCQIRKSVKFNSNDICLNTKDCNKPFTHRLFSNLKSVCKCNQKYSYKCKMVYCAKNEQTCDDFKSKQSKITVEKCNK